MGRRSEGCGWVWVVSGEWTRDRPVCDGVGRSNGK
jgi:hypothetical protein